MAAPPPPPPLIQRHSTDTPAPPPENQRLSRRGAPPPAADAEEIRALTDTELEAKIAACSSLVEKMPFKAEVRRRKKETREQKNVERKARQAQQKEKSAARAKANAERAKAAAARVDAARARAAEIRAKSKQSLGETGRQKYQATLDGKDTAGLTTSQILANQIKAERAEAALAPNGRCTADGCNEPRGDTPEACLFCPVHRSEAAVAAAMDGRLLTSAQWQADGSSKVCPLPECGKPWTLSRRRHHCRVCGSLCCAACSPHKLPLGDAKSKKKGARMCRLCFVAMGAAADTTKEETDADKAASGAAVSADVLKANVRHKTAANKERAKRAAKAGGQAALTILKFAALLLAGGGRRSAASVAKDQEAAGGASGGGGSRPAKLCRMCAAGTKNCVKCGAFAPTGTSARLCRMCVTSSGNKCMKCNAYTPSGKAATLCRMCASSSAKNCIRCGAFNP